MDNILRNWPGKSAGQDGVEHPAVLHMLDVAAVAELLAPALPHPVRQTFLLLAALHDLGKVNAAFRAMLRDGAGQSAGSHWEVTEALLRHHDTLLAGQIGGRWQARYALYAASAGHHGRPPDKNQQLASAEWNRMLHCAGTHAVDDAATVIRAFLELWPGASLEGLLTAQAQALSWQLAGLITAADWIGSNPDWFPPEAGKPDLGQYLERARAQARHAVATAGVCPPEVSDRTLFDFPPRPMQAACAVPPLNDGPSLALIEDETGSGKTEAALILAQRMMRAGKGAGLYIALPTMATADAMFARVSEVLKRLYTTAPSLVLAHGRAGLHQGFRDLAMARALNPDEPGPTEWLTDSRRRALLADVGVGTVDQALLAAVKAKHAPLRQFGLSRKILIVDEVHEMGDPYMGKLLAQLLHLQAAQGGSAILMSATLDLSLRSELVAAFETGAGRQAFALTSRAYPALTLPGVAVSDIPFRGSPRGVVAVKRLETAEQCLSLLTESARQGAACVWVRNAVDEVLSAVQALRDRGVEADLLHARYTLHDRKRQEASALATFGKGRGDRPGRVLVATQVVESSLDLDFDVMVSDLAPMASLVQRAGRLWRHMELRPASGRPVPGPALHVLSPDPARVNSENWANEALGQGAYVYSLPLLWRTAEALFKVGAIRAPEGLRDLIEAAHGEGEVPEALDRAELKAEGQAQAQKAHAAQNAIDWAAGYRSGASGAGDADYPTRLGQLQKVLVLMRDGAPWSGGGWSVDSCQLSEVQASLSRLSRLPLPESAAPSGLPDWLGQSRHFVPVQEDGTICEGLRYVREYGLMFEVLNLLG